MKTYKQKEIIRNKENSPRLYTFDEVKNNEGIYKAINLQNTEERLITLLNDFDEYQTIAWGSYGLESIHDPFWIEEKFERLENAKIIFDVIDGE